MKKIDKYLIAVQKDGQELQHIPEEKRTMEICLAAVQKDGRALEYVPAKKRTPEIYLAAVQQYGRVLQFIPEEEKTLEICLAAVKQNRLALGQVPEDKHAICLEAIDATPYINKEISEPKHLESFRYFKETIKTDGLESFCDFNKLFAYK